MRNLIFLLLSFSTLGISLLDLNRVYGQQSYGNEWIEENGSYFKFRLHENSVYRISQAQLNTIGMGNIPGSQFAIYREGKEIPIFVSSNGVFSSNDFIEFYGEKADGKVDSELYPDTFFQPNERVNLIADTAYYFLTYNTKPHQRLHQVVNNIPNPTPTPATHCWITVSPNETFNVISHGKNYDADANTSSQFFSSDYDIGEGRAYQNPSTKDRNYPIATPFKFVDANLNARLEVIVFGNSKANNGNNIQVRVNNNSIFDSTFAKYSLLKKHLNLSNAAISGNTTTVRLTGSQNYYCQGIYLTYPRQYNFSETLSQKAEFVIPANQRYVEITNFSAGVSAPRLIDLTNQKLYEAEVQANGTTLRFYLDASTNDRKCFLTNTSSIQLISAIESVSFKRHDLEQNQGAYIILTHRDFANATPNYIQQYKSYRESPIGGAHHVIIVEVEELYEQFGYGYTYHPMAIRRFLKYAYENWNPTPQYLFIVGKGLMWQNMRGYANSVNSYEYNNIVPTWGHPGSDNLLSSFNHSQIPALATGRLNAYNNQEIADYLEKITTYEQAIRINSETSIDEDYWKKRVLHIAGRYSNSSPLTFMPNLNLGKIIVEDTFTGMEIIGIEKTTTDPIEDVKDERVEELINEGVRYISFYGHSSSSGFEYNLNAPDRYKASPKFPIFLAFGCDVARIYNLNNAKTITEDYITSKLGGSIVMIAGNNLGYPSQLNPYLQNLYRSIAFRDYGKTLGMQYRNNIEYLQNNHSSDQMSIHTQGMLYVGDPGLNSHYPILPDFVLDGRYVTAVQSNINTTMDSFEIKVVPFNLGKSTHDSVKLSITHTKPGGSEVFFTDTLSITLMLSDTVYIKIPIDPNFHVGLNNYNIKIDADEKIDEISELNNEYNLQIFIYSENLIPVYPKEYAIVHEQGVELKASTLNAFAPLRRYKIEIDTTARFDSPMLRTQEFNSIGGIIKWKPDITLKDSVVYYWRTAVDTMINNQHEWTNSSFVYLEKGSPGWNQSHYYQYKNNVFRGLELNSNNYRFHFAPHNNHYYVSNAVVFPSTARYKDVIHMLNDIELDYWGCVTTGSIMVSIIDSVSGKPLEFTPQCFSRKYINEFGTHNTANRNLAMQYIESIPNGQYVLLRNLIHAGPAGPVWNQKVAEDWMNDTLTNGSGISLYHTLKNMGFDQIDQFDSRKTFIFFRKKGDSSYPVQQVVSAGDEKIELYAEPFFSYPDTGIMHSVIIGPASEWKKLEWKTSSNDGLPENDSFYVNIQGIDANGQSVQLYEGENKDLSLSFIAAKDYPYLNMSWNTIDNLNRTSANLDYWRIFYTPLPEAALNAAAYLEIKDSLQQGEKGIIKIAIENLTPIPMDSMLVKYRILDSRNLGHDLALKKYKPLLGNDTIIASLEFDPRNYGGTNFLYIEANPDNDQPEEYHPNNLGYIPFYLHADKKSPILDVTFDGVHILDRDIVSAKPFIKVLLKDDNKHMPLNDTALLQLKLAYPNSLANEIDIPIDGNICRFIPANLVDGRKNEAFLEFTPTLEQDGVYKLIVSGKDQAGNIAGNNLRYEIEFTVENKPSITNVLNYPNPFSTATSFVFTLTGSEIPSQFKIQILSVSGKIVKEITKEELGSLRIGRNVTEYKWDGRDQFGQLLGNGVYLYRVITSINGTEIEHRNNKSIDKFFKNGYGKLYIMR